MDKKNQEQYSPHTENHSYINNSTSNPPPPNYSDEYYTFTALYVLFVPIAITIIMGFIGIFEYTPLSVAFVTFLYAYLCIGKFPMQKRFVPENIQLPQNFMRLHLPIIRMKMLNYS